MRKYFKIKDGSIKKAANLIMVAALLLLIKELKEYDLYYFAFCTINLNANFINIVYHWD